MMFAIITKLSGGIITGYPHDFKRAINFFIKFFEDRGEPVWKEESVCEQQTGQIRDEVGMLQVNMWLTLHKEDTIVQKNRELQSCLSVHQMQIASHLGTGEKRMVTISKTNPLASPINSHSVSQSVSPPPTPRHLLASSSSCFLFPLLHSPCFNLFNFTYHLLLPRAQGSHHLVRLP